VSVSDPAVSSEVVVEKSLEPEITLYDVPLDEDIQRAALDICSEYDISYELILGICSTESAFKYEAIGDGGNSFGLMQIQPKWWSGTMEREDITNLLDPLQNIRCGCAILNELKTLYKTEYRALQAYNTGDPDSNSGYVAKIYKNIDKLKRKV
jgi:soluble lytic murein transglycosylase-like protein